MEPHLYELLRQCTVRVSVSGKTGHGTGFFVDRGLVLTCAHVIKEAQTDATSIDIYWKEHTYKAHISELRQEHDLVLLQVGLVDHPCVYLHEKATPFDSLYSYGYPDDHPSGDSATFTLEGKAGEQDEQLKLKTGQVRPGMSGAPLLNVSTRHVCGIIQITRDRHNDLGGRAIPTVIVFQAFDGFSAQHQLFHQQNKVWTDALWENIARTKYLEGMIQRYSSVTLPIDPAQSLSLNAIFQPLALRHDPLAVELLKQQKRRALLGESMPNDNLSPSQPAVAENGDDALQKTPVGRLVVLGGPGTGKTTFLKYLVGDRARKAITDSTSAIPIFLSLSDLARSGKPLLHYLVDLVVDMGIEDRYAHLLWQEIEVGNAFICMDGLDEVEPLRRPRIIALINDWGTRAGNTWVIGSRFTEYKGGQFTQARFAEWELMPLNHSLRLQLAQRLLPELQHLLAVHHSTSPQTAETFIQTLEEHPQAAAWGENPLLISLAAVVFIQTGNLPSTRTTLYRYVIEAVIETREPNPFRRGLLLRTLTELALWLQQTRGRTFSDEDLLTFFVDVQHKPIEETADLVYRIVSSGVMDVVSRKTYGFRHQTFQEYLAAAELVRRLSSQDALTRDDAWKLAWSKRTYSRWTEVLRLMLGELVRSSSSGRELALRWLDALLKQRETEDGDPGNLALELALVSLTEVTGMSEWNNPKATKLGEHIVLIWVNAILDSPTQTHIETVAQELSHLPEPLARIVIEHSLAVLSSQDEKKLQAVTAILKRQGQRVPLEPLLEALHAGESQTRIATLQILAVQGERVPLEPLFAALRQGDWVGNEAAKALIAQGKRVPVEPLIQVFHEMGSFSVYDVLKSMGERVPFEPFLPYLLDDKYSHFYWSVACGIVGTQKERLPLEIRLAILRNMNMTTVTTFGWFSRIGKYIPAEALFDLLQDENEWTRWATAKVLEERVATLPRQKLLDMMQHWDVRVRLTILNALYMQSEYVPVEALLETLHDSTYPVRGAAMAALGKNLPQDVLLEGLQHEHEAMHIGAIKAIGAQGQEADISLLAPALQDQHSRVRYEAVKALGMLVAEGVSVPSAWVLMALHDADLMVQSAAGEALTAMGEYIPLEFLISILEEGVGVGAQHAYEALKAIRDQIPADTLLEQLQRSPANTRCAAIYILGIQGEQCPVDVLLPSLQDTRASVRRTAVEVLGIQQRRLLGEALLTVLRDDDNGVRYVAAQALQLLEKQAPVEGVLIALKDHDQEIRRIAAKMCKIQELDVPVEAMIAALNYVDRLMASATTLHVNPISDSARIPVIEAISKRDEEHAQDALEYALLYDDEDTVRHAVARALCRQWGPLTQEQLDNILELLQDENEYQRRAAVEILEAYGNQGDAVPIEVFLHILHQEQEEIVKSAVIDALLAQGERVPPEIVQDLLQVGGQYKVLKGLVARGDFVPLSLLLNALTDRETLYAYDIIVQALELQGQRLPINVLLQALHSTNEEIREAAVRVLKASKKHVPVDLLRAHMQDEDEQLQSCVLEILATYGEPLPLELLMPVFYKANDTIRDDERRKRIVRALVAQGERVPLASLLPGLYHEDDHMRQSTLVVLRALKKLVPLETLLLLLGDENIKVVRIAALMLYESYPERMKPVSSEAAAIVQGESPGTTLSSITQCFLASTIAGIGYPAPEFLDALTKLLRWPHWQVRLKAIRALGGLRRNIPDEAIRLLLQLRRDPNPLLQVIRDAADHALVEILSLESGIEDDPF
jgi:HEAT repeat protein